MGKDMILADYETLTESQVTYMVDCLNKEAYGDAVLASQLFKDQLVYDHKRNVWYVWMYSYWQEDTSNMARLFISKDLASYYELAASSIYKHPEYVETAPRLIAECNKRARQLQRLNRCNETLTFLQSMDGMFVLGHEWDSDVWRLGTPVGEIDLHTGELLPGEPGHYIRTITTTPYRELDTPCPRFCQFLQEIFEDQPEHREEIIAYLQRLLGYAITGLSSEAVLPVLAGEEGRNGKTTLINMLKKILGNVATSVSKDVMIASGRRAQAGAATPHLMPLQGRRLAWVEETQQGDKVDGAGLKKLTGNSEQNGRSNYRDQETWQPTHTLILVTNHKPHADSDDKAFFSRVKVINFGMRFIEEPLAANERKADLKLEETLAHESSGILAWLVRGCLEYQRIGLSTPPCVRLATEEYRNDEDIVAAFMSECVSWVSESSVKVDLLYRAYTAWCEETGVKAMNKLALGRKLTRKYPQLLKKQDGYGCMTYHGIALTRGSPIPPSNGSTEVQRIFTQKQELLTDHFHQSRETLVQEQKSSVLFSPEENYNPIEEPVAPHESNEAVNENGQKILCTLEKSSVLSATIAQSTSVEATKKKREQTQEEKDKHTQFLETKQRYESHLSRMERLIAESPGKDLFVEQEVATRVGRKEGHFVSGAVYLKLIQQLAGHGTLDDYQLAWRSMAVKLRDAALEKERSQVEQEYLSTLEAKGWKQV